MILGTAPPPFWLLWAIQQTAGQPIDGDRSAILAASISTPGISRNMAQPQPTGGGNLNGSANTALLIGQAGTAGQRIAMPRTVAGNYTGIV
jgi:hypothetical protein